MGFKMKNNYLFKNVNQSDRRRHNHRIFNKLMHICIRKMICPEYSGYLIHKSALRKEFQFRFIQKYFTLILMVTIYVYFS